MGAAAVRAAESVGYTNAGTCEFMLDSDGRYYFLEMNARLQVEHPVTELVYGIDLVQWQLRIASGERLTLAAGRARAARLGDRERASTPRIPPTTCCPRRERSTRWSAPEGPGVRVDAGVATGSEVSHYYDPMLAKLIVYGSDRASAIARLQGALRRLRDRRRAHELAAAAVDRARRRVSRRRYHDELSRAAPRRIDVRALGRAGPGGRCSRRPRCLPTDELRGGSATWGSRCDCKAARPSSR